jgi:hypothetical protein
MEVAIPNVSEKKLQSIKAMTIPALYVISDIQSDAIQLKEPSLLTSPNGDDQIEG